MIGIKRKNKMKYIFIAFILSLLSSCVTAPKDTIGIGEVNSSIAEIKKIANKTIGGIRAQSENGREIESNYYSLYEDDEFDPETADERAYTKVYILGDRRPYKVRVAVIVERKKNAEFKFAEFDKSLALVKAKELKSRLTEGLGNRNMIDDFRAF